MRVPLRSRITFKNVKITYQSELIFLGIYLMENLKWGAHALLLRIKLYKVIYMIKALKKTMSPNMIRNIYYLNFQ
jgi:hypothetical protein